MSRRAMGLFMLTMVLIAAALAGSVLGGIRVAGSAVAMPRLGAPDVGECVADLIGPVSVGLPTGSITLTTVGEQAVRFADCSRDHLGEVLAYRVGDTAGTTSTPNDQWCVSIGTGYQSEPTWQVADTGGEEWTPEGVPRFVLILGAPAGAKAFTWAACALTAPGFEKYRGSYARSSIDGSMPAPFGQCRQQEGSAAWASCSAPHRSQEFGTVMGSVSPATLASCRELIGRMTGMPDITANGLLRPDLVPPNANGDGDSAAAAQFNCRLSVVGGRSLDGTLVGLGSNPLPWA